MEIKIIQAERLDYVQPRQNCATCVYKSDNLCIHFGAYLQKNPNKPNDCRSYQRNEVRDV